MRIYEELFIVRPDAPEEEIDQLIEQLTTPDRRRRRQRGQIREMGRPQARLSRAKAQRRILRVAAVHRETGNGAGSWSGVCASRTW